VLRGFGGKKKRASPDFLSRKHYFMKNPETDDSTLFLRARGKKCQLGSDFQFKGGNRENSLMRGEPERDAHFRTEGRAGGRNSMRQ